MKSYTTIKTHQAITHVLLAFAAILVLTACQQKSDSDSKVQGMPIVSVFQVREAPFSLEITASGELMPDEEAEIRAPLGGNVMKIHFREGQNVKQGDLLVELDHRVWVARKRGLEAQLASATTELTRREALVRIEGVSMAEYEQAMAEVDQLKAQIEELEVMIDQARIRAPFSGTVGLRNFSPGSYMAQGAPITRIVNTRRLKVRFTIPGKYSAYIKPGQTLTVRTSTQEHQGVATVYALDPAIQTTSRTLEVRAHLDNPTGLFMAGDFAEISIGLAQQPKTILIPPEAIVPELNRQIVFVVVDGIAHRREVKTGAHTRDSIEITEGLRDGDKVVLTGLMTLKEGANVEVRTEEKEDRK